MANKYALRYLPVAVDDLVSIFDWIAGDNLKNATVFIENIDQRIGSLKTYPFLGRLPRDEQLGNAGYRVLVIESYRAFYVVHGRTVEIHRVVHGSRNLEDIL